MYASARCMLVEKSLCAVVVAITITIARQTRPRLPHHGAEQSDCDIMVVVEGLSSTCLLVNILHSFVVKLLLLFFNLAATRQNVDSLRGAKRRWGLETSVRTSTLNGGSTN